MASKLLLSSGRSPERRALVRFVGVGKSYDARTRVVEDLHLDLMEGEFLTLLGPSGSGKTTTLMMLAGFEPWTSGDILMGGRSLAGIPPHKRGMGVVFQNYALFPHMTIGRNVGFPLRQRGVAPAEAKARVRQALQTVELETFANRHPSQLSGGQQQRVALARALVFDPKLVLMDEPLGALDRRLREQMQIEIKRLHDRIGMTVVYVTHDQDEALTMSDRIAIFNCGRIEQIGSPQEIYERPATRFVANFIGDNNDLLATVERTQGEQALLRLSGGEAIEAVAVGTLPQGSVVRLSLRPELIAIGPALEGFDNRLDVTLAETIYCGDHALLRCCAGESQILTAKVPLAQCRGVEPGARLIAAWHAEDCRALPV